MFEHEWEVYLREMWIAQFYAVRIYHKNMFYAIYASDKNQRFMSEFFYNDFMKLD